VTPRELARAGRVWLAVVGLTLAAGRVPAATYRVTPETVADVAARLRAGDTMILADGRYDALRLEGLRGTAGAPITVQAENERRAFIQGTGRCPALDVRNCSHVHAIGLRVENADNEQNRDTSNAGVVHLAGCDHCVVRRILAARPNRWGNNTGISLGAGTRNSLVEECELYDFHRNGISIHNAPGATGARDNTLRRNYVNARNAKYLGRRWGPNDGIVMYRGLRNTIENCIVEEVPDKWEHFAAFAAWGRNNAYYGCIALRAKQGYIPATVTNRGDADHVRYEHCLAIGSTHNGWAIQTVLGLAMRNCTAVGNAAEGFSASTGRIEYRDDAFRASLDVENSLSVNNGGRGFVVNDLGNFRAVRIDHCGGWSNHRGTWGPGTAGATNALPDRDPRFDGSYIAVSPKSPCKGAGRDGADVGASILDRYENGVLTDEPLWDPATGAFPHGAIIEGVNDVSGQSLFDVHERLGVTPALLAEVRAQRATPAPLAPGSCRAGED